MGRKIQWYVDLKWKVKIYGRDKGKLDLKNNRTEMKGEKRGKGKVYGNISSLFLCGVIPDMIDSWAELISPVPRCRLPVIGDFQYFNVMQKIEKLKDKSYCTT